MPATDYTTLIARIRAEASDKTDSNPVFGETPVGTRDGVNVNFRLQNSNLLSGVIATVQYGPWRTYGATYRSLAGYTVADAVNSVLTLTAAPDATTMPFFLDYYFQWFTDATYTSWIDTATEELGGAAGTGLAEGLYGALIQYALDKYWTNRASLYANKHAVSGYGTSESLEAVTKAYLELAKLARKKGDALRDAYYQAFGQQLKPSSYTVSYGMNPWAPKR